MTQFTRRKFIQLVGAGSATAALSACSTSPSVHTGRYGRKVVIIGGGPGGATAAKYLKRFGHDIDVTLIEPKATYHTCFGSNWVLGGLAQMSDIAQTYGALQDRYGIRVIADTATGIDTTNNTVTLASGETVSFEKLVVSPGISMRWDSAEGYSAEVAETRMPHAWQAGPQTKLLRRQLEAMPNGGTFIIVAPGNPFRCPPGPYERASMAAHYFKRFKPRSKVLILDNKEAFSKQGLFMAGWKELYGDMIEWVPSSEGGQVERVDAQKMTVYSDGGFNEFKGDVINFIPRQQAGAIARYTGLTNDTGWCPVNQQTFASSTHEHVYVIGDASIAGAMPKSGHSANTQGKLVAAAIVRALDGDDPVAPSLTNTCYSLLAPDYGITVAAVYRFSDGSIKGVQGAGGVSPADASREFRTQEANYARGWYAAITSDSWG